MNLDDRMIRRSGLTLLAAILASAGAFADAPAVPPPEGDNPKLEANAETNTAAPVEPAPGGNPLSAISLSALSATRERPIFSPSRRPPAVAAPADYVPEPPPEVRPAEPERPTLSLIGTVKGSEQGIGIFLNQTNNEVIRLHLGEASSGWTLRSIDRRKIVLEKDNQQVSLEIPAPGAVTATDATSPAAPPAARPEGYPGIGAHAPPGIAKPPGPAQMPGSRRFGGRHTER
jgi:general secretion pathway protein N